MFGYSKDSEYPVADHSFIAHQLQRWSEMSCLLPQKRNRYLQVASDERQKSADPRIDSGVSSLGTPLTPGNQTLQDLG
jgi:hypothetical protein